MGLLVAKAVLVLWVGATATALACESDADCSLLGICSAAGRCECDAGWTGPDCGNVDNHAQNISKYMCTSRESGNDFHHFITLRFN